MKKSTFALLTIGLLLGSMIQAQNPENYISCKVNGKEWKAEAKRMKIPIKGFEYLALAAFQVSPDVQVWIRLYYWADSLKPGTYPILSEKELDSGKKADRRPVYVLVDYTEETKGLGHAYHDGESLSGTLTISALTKTSVEGSFDATLTGVFFKKRTLATITGSGIRANLTDKLITGAGGGMLVNGDPHYHDNTKKTSDTDTLKLTDGKFRVDWTENTQETKK